MTLQRLLHPDVARWFETSLGDPTAAQAACLPHILAKRSVLLSSPTGTGKTLAAFLGVLDGLYREQGAGSLPTGEIRAVYVSPLRALTYDMRKNLMVPIEGLGMQSRILVASRTGDTSAGERAAIRRRPPHLFLTTPESLAIVLSQPAYRDALRSCEYVIVDELHALAENKRGAHLMVSLERLENLVARPLCRVGLSATVAPLERVAQFLTGPGRPCRVLAPSWEKESLVEVLTPLHRSAYPPAGYAGSRMIADVARIVEENRTTLIFTNTRSNTENVSMRLRRMLPALADQMETHHSSLDRDLRLEVEDRLKDGQLRAVVCSTSLELGIDIGSVDSVVMMSTPKGISRALQRIGRSGHSIRQMSHGVLVATNINDLIECVVCAEMAKRRRLDPVAPLENALDVAIQHVVGMAMEGGYTVEDAWSTLRRSDGFRSLTRADFDSILRYLEGGGASLEAQYRATFGKIEIRDGLLTTVSKAVERSYLVNVGTIAAAGAVRVVLDHRSLGEVEEGFAKSLAPGDIFVMAGRTVRLEESGVEVLYVSAADGRLPTIPSWNANKMPLASGLAEEVRRFRTELWTRLVRHGESAEEISGWLVEGWNISRFNAEAILEHFGNQLRFSTIPREGHFLIEAFRDEGNDPDRVHYFFHSLIGRSANDALSRIIACRVQQAVGGNALVTIDDYGFLLSMKTFQAMGLEEWKELFQPEEALSALESALRGSELVKWQFSGVAQTGLMVPRNLPGKERKLKQLRWSSEILFRVLSEREPDHPLLRQAYRDAMHTFLDSGRAMDFLREARSMDWELIEVPAVTPFSFGMYMSKIREGMMLEDPEEAMERLFHEMNRRLQQAASGFVCLLAAGLLCLGGQTFAAEDSPVLDKPRVAALENGGLRCGAGSAVFSNDGRMSIFVGGDCLVRDAGLACGLHGYLASPAFEDGQVQRKPGEYVYGGRLPGHPVRFRLEAAPEADALRIRVKRQGSWPPAASWCAFQLDLPLAAFAGSLLKADGKEVALPEENLREVIVRGARHLVFSPGDPRRRLEIFCATGVDVRDGRAWGMPVYQIGISVRDGADPGRAEASLLIRFPEGRSEDLRPRLCVPALGYSAGGLKEVTMEWPRGEARPADAVRIQDLGGRVLVQGRFGPTLSPEHMQSDFASFAFSELREPGTCKVVWDAGEDREIEIKPTIFSQAVWVPTLRDFLPWQMCHAAVKFEGGRLPELPACHLDDARRVPANFPGIDGFRSYECDLTPFKEGDMIPCGAGGWHDAGDYDLNVHAQAHTTWKLALAHEEFCIQNDETTLDLAGQRVVVGVPDGVPDILQQVQWGAVWLLAMQQGDGLVYPGVCGRPGGQYTSALTPEKLSDGQPGTGDERHLYVDYQPASQLAHVIALAAAGRVLKTIDPELAGRCTDAARLSHGYYVKAPRVYRPNVYFSGGAENGRDGAGVAALAELYLTTRSADDLAELERRSPEIAGLPVAWPSPYATSCGQWWYAPSTLARLVGLLREGRLKSAILRLCERASREQASQASPRPWPLQRWHLLDWGAAGHCLARPFDAYYLEKAVPGIFRLADTQREMLWMYGYHPLSEALFVCVEDPAMPAPKFLYNGRLHGRHGSAAASVAGAVIPGMSGIEDADTVFYHDAHGNYRQNEACIYTAADYLFAVHALKSAGY